VASLRKVVPFRSFIRQLSEFVSLRATPDVGHPVRCFLLGGDTLPSIKAGAEAVDEALANSRMVVMPGQGHVAMNTGVELFTTEVTRFLTAE
jgi:hypothetical protein